MFDRSPSLTSRAPLEKTSAYQGSAWWSRGHLNLQDIRRSSNNMTTDQLIHLPQSRMDKLLFQQEKMRRIVFSRTDDSHKDGK